jgi:polysaccharide deacetylase family protein (PEP-CTERM system associated)
MMEVNFLTFDLEEWFHILGLQNNPIVAKRQHLPSRVNIGLSKFLDLLSFHELSATIFVLGFVANKYPLLIKRIAEEGHEIASHGYDHELIYKIGPQKFRQDIRRSKLLLEDLSGNAVIGYRGPGFSITKTNSWAFDIIAEEGFRYDSTLYPGRHGHGGIPRTPRKPFILKTPKGYEIEEYPITLLNFRVYQVAFAGGGYFRLFPLIFIEKCIRWMNRKKVPVMTYFHPRDLDPGVPRISMPLIRQIKCYINISKSYDKLNKLLSIKSFSSIQKWRLSNRQSLPSYSLSKFLN